jgi:signal transduction histidine kinase
VVIEVADNGPGMEPAVLHHAFEPFFTTKEPGLGTGLGLSVSYFIVTSHHNGSIEVESELGAGAKFIIRLPV